MTEPTRSVGIDDPRGQGRRVVGSSASSSATLAPLPLSSLGDAPLVSVLVTNHNYEAFIGDALQSLRDQTYARWEAIVCDDASDDGSREIVSSFAAEEPRITLVVHPANRGQAAAFNTAFARASGEVICFLDSDDTFEPGKIEAVVGALRDGSAGVAVHPLMMVDAQGSPIQRVPALTMFEQGWLAPRVVRRGGRWRWVPTSGAGLRREVAARIFPMPEERFFTSADTFFLVLAPLLTPVVALDDVQGTYRRHGSNAYARARLDAARVRSAMTNLEAVLEAVNDRMAVIVGHDRLLRVGDNLKYRELEFQEELLEGRAHRRALAGRYLDLMRGYMSDDLYGGPQKAWAWVLYGGALLAPRSLRARWLSASLSASGAKELARRVVAASRRRRR
ncbi:MAG: glycosyltransferase family 2 protein [Actinomycetota bacterium]